MNPITIRREDGWRCQKGGGSRVLEGLHSDNVLRQ